MKTPDIDWKPLALVPALALLALPLIGAGSTWLTYGRLDHLNGGLGDHTAAIGTGR